MPRLPQARESRILGVRLQELRVLLVSGSLILLASSPDLLVRLYDRSTGIGYGGFLFSWRL